MTLSSYYRKFMRRGVYAAFNLRAGGCRCFSERASVAGIIFPTGRRPNY
jgi:hypothetical protein